MVISRKMLVALCATIAAVAGAITGTVAAWPHVEPGTPVLWYQFRSEKAAIRNEYQQTLNELLQWKFEESKQKLMSDISSAKIMLEQSKDQSPQVKALIEEKITALSKQVKEVDDRLSMLRLRK